MDITIHKFVEKSMVDGPGVRAVLFFQGCPIECFGCQNKHLWEKRQGATLSVKDVARKLAGMAAENGGNVTISGGEPFAQVRALSELLRLLKDVYGVKNIIVYTGYLWEYLTSANLPIDTHCSVLAALSRIDTLVDGPFIKALDDPFITYRGSRNQRPIDVQASLKSWGDPSVGPVILDWNLPEISIDTAGSVVLPAGLVKDFEDIGQVEKSRMCGQTKGLPDEKP